MTPRVGWYIMTKMRATAVGVATMGRIERVRTIPRPQNCRRPHHEDREVEGPDEGFVEPPVGQEEAEVVGRAHEFGRRQARGEPLVEAHPPRVEHGVDDDEDDGDGRGGREDVGGVPVGRPPEARAQVPGGSHRYPASGDHVLPGLPRGTPDPGSPGTPYFSVLSKRSWNCRWASAITSAGFAPSMAFWIATPMMSRYWVTSTISGSPARPILRLSW